MANNLKALRKKHNMTQPELAKLMGTTKDQLIKLENGARRLTEDWIRRAANALGEPMGAFIDDVATPAQSGSGATTSIYVGFDPIAFGRRLQLIVDAGFSDLRERINMEPVRWQAYLNGRGTPDPAVYSAIVDATGLAESFVKFGVPDEMVRMLLALQAERNK